MPSNGSGIDTTPKQDVILSLIENSQFKIRSEDEKLSILRQGRPTPKLNIIKRDNIKNCNRTFKETWYSTHRWLCGSSQLNKLFCWPCLLMRPETSAWCSTGCDDVKRLSSMTSKHATCKAHLKALNEYDATLVGFGLLPEFPNETNCKQENSIESDDEDCDEDFFTESNEKKKVRTEYENPYTRDSKAKSHQKDKFYSDDVVQINDSTSGLLGNSSVENQMSSSVKQNPITFKAWQEMNHSSLMSMNAHWLSEKKLSRLKKKIARQELRNAQMISEKIKIEINLLKSQLHYQHQLSSELAASEPDKTSKANETDKDDENIILIN